MRSCAVTAAVTHIPYGGEMGINTPANDDDQLSMDEMCRDEDIIAAAEQVLGRRIEGAELAAWIRSIAPEIDH